MKYVLVKHNSLKLLVNEGLPLQPILEHIASIEELANNVNGFHLNLLSATKEQGAALDAQAQALISKIGYKIIGVPFTNHDAELYALDKKMDYTELELTAIISAEKLGDL